MKKLLDVTGKMFGIMETIKETLNGAGTQIFGSGTRRLLVTTQEGDLITVEHLSAIAYKKGLTYFHKLYGSHVKRVFEEQNLATSGVQYISFSSLKMKLTQDFEQTLTLEAKDRTAYAGSLFDKSMQKNKDFAPSGLVKISTSGSIESSIRYSMIMEGNAKAEFKYNVGAGELIFDIASEKDTVFENKNLTPSLKVKASAGLAGTMSVNFAASASFAIYIGIGLSGCITIVLDTSQISAAGFDVLGGVNLERNFSPLYTDVLEYTDQESCTPSNSDDADNVAVHAGYWQYIGAPSAKVAVHGTGFCTKKSHELVDLEAKVLQNSTGDFCIGFP